MYCPKKTHYNSIIMDKDALGYWASGLVDGEGSFLLHVTKRSLYPHIFFTFGIALRDDDQAALIQLQQALGGLGQFQTTYKDCESRKPQSRFTITGKKNLLLVADFFERYPLRTKKRTDFEIWAVALRYYSAKRLAGFSAEQLFEEMQKRAQQLQDNRRYGHHTTTA